MGGGTAFWGGFSSFFSIWQLCIMQVSPFFVAFLAGIYLAVPGGGSPGTLRRMILSCLAYGLGFSVVYALLIASGLDMSWPLIHRLGLWRIVSAGVILIAGLYILLAGRLSLPAWVHGALPLGVLSALFGVALAVIYSPCITPMLSDIMSLASQRSTAAEGWYLAFWYGLGISVALCLTTITLIAAAKRYTAVVRNARPIRAICGIILLALAAMNMTGLMRHYKAFVLGLVL